MIIATFTGQLATDAVNPTQNFCADPGSTNSSPALEQQRYPTTARLFTKLRVVSTNGPTPFVTPIVVTLWKNGIKTPMSVSIPDSTPQYTQFLDQTHPVYFNDGDTYDVAISNAGGVSGQALVTVTLEGP